MALNINQNRDSLLINPTTLMWFNTPWRLWSKWRL